MRHIINDTKINNMLTFLTYNLNIDNSVNGKSINLKLSGIIKTTPCFIYYFICVIACQKFLQFVQAGKFSGYFGYQATHGQ